MTFLNWKSLSQAFSAFTQGPRLVNTAYLGVASAGGLGCDQVHCVTKIPSLANHSLCGRVITDAYVLSEVSTKSTTLTVRNVPDVAQLN